MYPGGRQLVLSDLSNVRRVLRIVKPALLPAVDEFRMRVKGEFTTVKRQPRWMRVEGTCGRSGPGSRVKSPSPRPCRSFLSEGAHDGLAEREELRSDLEERLYKAQGSNALVKGLRLWRLQRGPLSLKRVAAAQGALIFGEGSPGFSADPHPGNVMVLEDGRLGLIDYGCSCSYMIKKSRCWLTCVITSITTIEEVLSKRSKPWASPRKGWTGLYVRSRRNCLTGRRDGGLFPQRLRAAARREGRKIRASAAHVPRVALAAGAGAASACRGCRWRICARREVARARRRCNVARDLAVKIGQ